jgi:menaquinone-dependent protoporphyrinogen oxidase
MKNEVLVTFASTSGSTQEVAEKIATTFTENGLAADILPIRDVRQLEGYRLVVLGAPLYMFRWHKDAHRFLSKFRKSLEDQVPVAVFAGGPTETGNDEEFREVREQLNKELARYPWFRPHAVEIVGGRLDPSLLKFPWTMIPALKQMPARDLRDWKAIKAWAIGLSSELISVQKLIGVNHE